MTAMTPAAAADLLALAAAFDRRTIGKADAVAWADALHDLAPADCAEAIRAHFRDSTDYLMPAHVRQGVKRIRADRIRSANSAIFEPDDANPDDVAAYLAAIRDRRQAVADGQTITPVPLAPADPERVQKLLRDTAKALPAMPPASPRNDERNNRRTA